MSRGSLGIIAGTGFSRLDLIVDPVSRIVETAYGPAQVLSGTLHGRPAHFVPRHGPEHSVPPHMINYRGLVQALADLGVTEILAVNVVGGIGHEAGEIVVVDDFIDFTHQRIGTFFDGSTREGVVHVDVSAPYDERLRQAWLAAAADIGVPVTPHGVYAAFDGPRFESKAEIRMADAAGATVVGMTGLPEVVLAVERGIPYASLCLVANPAAGQGSEPITVDDVLAVIAQGADTVTAILDRAARRLSEAAESS